LPSAQTLFVNSVVASIAPRTNVRDDRDTPLFEGTGWRYYAADLGQTQNEIFLRKGLDTISSDLPPQQNQLVPTSSPG
jgi:hypothetical protein